MSFTARLTPRTAARTVELMRFNPESGLWRRVATRAVNRATGTAVLPWQVEQGRTLLRLGLNRRTTAPGLAPVNSASIRVTGVGEPPDESKRKPPKRRQK